MAPSFSSRSDVLCGRRVSFDKYASLLPTVDHGVRDAERRLAGYSSKTSIRAPRSTRNHHGIHTLISGPCSAVHVLPSRVDVGTQLHKQLRHLEQVLFLVLGPVLKYGLPPQRPRAQAQCLFSVVMNGSAPTRTSARAASTLPSDAARKAVWRLSGSHLHRFPARVSWSGDSVGSMREERSHQIGAILV